MVFIFDKNGITISRFVTRMDQSPKSVNGDFSFVSPIKGGNDHAISLGQTLRSTFQKTTPSNPRRQPYRMQLTVLREDTN